MSGGYGAYTQVLFSNYKDTIDEHKKEGFIATVSRQTTFVCHQAPTLFSSLRRRGLGTRNEGLLHETVITRCRHNLTYLVTTGDFMYAVILFLYTVWIVNGGRQVGEMG